MNINWLWASTGNPCLFTAIFVYLFSTSCHIFVFCDYLMHLCNVFTYVINKFQTPVQGHTDIPGEQCHRHGKWDTEFRRWFVCYWKEARQGCQWMHRQVGWIWLCMHKAFLSNKGKQMIVTSFNDVTVVLLMLKEGGYIREHAWALGSSLGEFSGCLVIVEGHFLSFNSRGPLTPYLSYLSALWGVGLSQTGKCYLLFSSVAYTQG